MVVGALEVLEKSWVGWGERIGLSGLGSGYLVVWSIIVSLQSSLELELGGWILSLEFRVGLDFDWTSA